MSTALDTAQSSVELDPAGEADLVLAWHAGDAKAAIVTLLEDCKHLRQQLAVTEVAMSSGFTRGWKPAFDRD